MKKRTFSFCTIITEDHLHYALALLDSLLEFDENAELFMLVAEEKISHAETQHEAFHGRLHYIFPEEFCSEGTGKLILDKYFHSDKDCFRWSMKPLLMKYLLQKKQVDKVIYVDSDIQFYNNYDFLFNFFSDYNIILSPHFRSLDPNSDPINFEKNFKEGIYNGGFIGSNLKGIKALDWWATACLYKCSKNFALGLYDDQKYLDLLPSRFENVLSLNHLGCNISEWNMNECPRILINDEVKIKGTHPVVFVHFTKHTILNILEGIDPLLRAHLDKYNERLKKYKPGFDLVCQFNEIRIQETEKPKTIKTKKNKSAATYIKKVMRKVTATVIPG